MALKRIIAGVLLLLQTTQAWTQVDRVGLVLSGGGARGIAHIGLIQALEDHDIPIDYVTGTSMGAIIGSLYALGYSPDDMLNLVTSEDFKLWQAGEFDQDMINYYKLEDPTPEIFTFKTSFKNSSPSVSFLPESLIDPSPMNLAFLKLYAHGTIRCGEDFNRLFVPFRAIASDVYNKQELVLSSGSLGDAVRASMSFPFVFKPIEINGVLVYDGGIYNNFPVNVMKEDFAPDFIIGSVVSDNPSKPEEGDFMTQIENMVMQKTDYTIPSADGVVIRYDLQDVSLLDTHRAKEIYKQGYEKGLEFMEEIQLRVDRRMPQADLAVNRAQYRSLDPHIEFKDVNFTGVNKVQQGYLEKQFRYDDGEQLSMNDIERTYIDLLSDSRLAEIRPTVQVLDSNAYALNLDVILNKELQMGIGGLISSTNDNRIYVGAKYQFLSSFAADLDLSGQIGKAYSALDFNARVSLPTYLPFYLNLYGAMYSKKYYENESLFASSEENSSSEQRQRYLKLHVGFPMGLKGKMFYGVGYGRLQDRYFANPVLQDGDSHPDRSIYHLYNMYADLRINQMTEKDFHTRGYRHHIKAAFLTGRDNYYAARPEGSYGVIPPQKSGVSWVQLSHEFDKYWTLHEHFSLGASSNVHLSTKPRFANYMATLLQATPFAPTMHSQTVFNPAYRSNNFIALGVKPIWKITSGLQLRGEVYGFQNLQKFVPTVNHLADIAPISFDVSFISELSVVYKLPFVTLSAYVNHYSAGDSDWNVGLNIGYMLNVPRFY